MALIELDKLSRRYRFGDIDVVALDDITLSIEAGEYVAVVGPSGSGKSTLMNVLGCLDSHTSGTFCLDGRDVSKLNSNELAALRREYFGFIFQRYHLLAHLDSLANAALPAVYSGVSKATREARARSLLKRLGLEQCLNRQPSKLSGGQQQRVSIARALMNGGQIIFADEPTGALDSASGAEVLMLLEELNALGHTIILVTHDSAVANHAQRVIELRDGKLQKDTGTHPDCRREMGRVVTPAEEHSKTIQLRTHLQEAVHAAWTSLRNNRLRTGLSMLGISIGIASVISIVALTTAARISLEAEMQGFLAGRIPVVLGNSSLPPGALPQPFKPAELNALRSLDGVKAVSVDFEAQVTARYHSKDVRISAIGADPNALVARKLSLSEGRNLNALDLETSAQVVVIDKKTRTTLFKPGQTVLGETILIALGDDAQLQGQPVASAGMPVKIVGVVDSQGGATNYGNWNGVLLLPLTTYSRKFDTRTDIQRFNVLLDFSVPPSQVRDQVVHRLIALHGREDFSAINLDAEFRKFQSVTSIIAMIFAGIGAIALLVGGVGVMNIMLVSVSERTREVGIRMAIGARQSNIHLQFLIEAIMLCCLGGLVGLALGGLGAQIVNLMQEQLKVQITWTALVVAFVASTIVGLLFGTLPARRAAALSPIDALARE